MTERARATETARSAGALMAPSAPSTRGEVVHLRRAADSAESQGSAARLLNYAQFTTGPVLCLNGGGWFSVLKR